jgi:hypothetical protein
MQAITDTYLWMMEEQPLPHCVLFSTPHPNRKEKFNDHNYHP